MSTADHHATGTAEPAPASAGTAHDPGATDATYRSQLTPLLADLPHEGGPSLRATRPAPAWAELWRAFVWRLRLLVYRDDAATRPTPAQCRAAVLLAVAALTWLLVCALAGAVAVGA